MKLVKCIVRPHKVEQTTDALQKLDVSGVTVTRVGGRGRHHEPRGFWKHESEARYLAQAMIDVVVADHLVDDVVRVVMQTAHTGEQGDGRVFVIPLEEAYSIRTRAGGID